MRGVILAGGLGSRLAPLTFVTNKHLLPIYDRPMIYYAIENLVKSGIKEILIVTGGHFAGHFLHLLRNGKELGVDRLVYAYQKGEGGIADALQLAESFVADQHFCVLLGDNLYQYCLKPYVDFYRKNYVSAGCDTAMLVVTPTSSDQDPTRFGIAFSHEAKLRTGDVITYEPASLIEKPQISLINNLHDQGFRSSIVTGAYFYPPSVFDVCRGLKPSARGELEITDVNLHYLNRNCLISAYLEGWWADAGTFESLHAATNMVLKYKVNQ